VQVVLSNSSYKWGGVHAVTELLARGLLARGHEVTVLARPDSQLERRMQGVAPTVPILRGTDLGPVVIARCARALLTTRAQVVVTLMDKDLRLTGVAARLLRLPVVARRSEDRPLAGRWRSFFYRRVATHVVANSEATRATLLESTPALGPRGIQVIRNGIGVDAFANAVPARLDLPPNAVVFGFLGRFEERKGVQELLDAWPPVAAAVPAAHLVLVGGGALEARARQRMAGDERVRFTGYRTDAAALLRAFDVVVMPSHWEGFGLVAAEAMGAGLPVIGTDASSLPEIVRDGVSGRLVPVRDAAALARAMTELGTDAELRARMGRAGLAIARREFTAEVMVDRWEALLQRIVDARAGRQETGVRGEPPQPLATTGA
jgi:glycosyltransferase involved in cell wall biosynthesis